MRKSLTTVNGAILLCALTINAQQPSIPDGFEFKANQSVYLIAIRTSDPPDSRMMRLFDQVNQEKALQLRKADKRFTTWTQVPPNIRLLQVRPGPERTILERSISEPDTLTSTDLAVKTRLEEEFKKRKKFKLADSTESADVVLFAISRYASDIFQVGPRGGITATSLVGEGYGDRLMSLVAFAIPAATYRRTKKDFTELGNVAKWEGAKTGTVTINTSAGRNDHSVKDAPVRDLIEKFHNDVLQKNTGAFHVPAQSAQPLTGSSTQPTEAAKKQPALSTSEQNSPRNPALVEPQDRVAIKLETSLVVMPLSVLDRYGRYIPSLTRRDFHIYEDNVEQQIDHFSAVEDPFHLVLLLDTSGSVQFKAEAIQDAAFAFVEQLRPQDRLMVLSFDSRIYINSEFTSDHTQLIRAIYRIQNRGGTGGRRLYDAVDCGGPGGTRLYDAVDLALTERLKYIQGRKAIVLFTDGVDTESRLTSAPRTLELVEESGVLVYIVQYDTKSDADKGAKMFGPPDNQIYIPNATISGPEAYDIASKYLIALVERAGGYLYRPENLSNLNQSLSLIADDLRHQYAISYYPINTARDGTYRSIRVTVDQPNASVLARAGYRAAGTTPIREMPPAKGTSRP